MLFSYHHSQFPQPFHHPKEKLRTHKPITPTTFSPIPGKHHSIFWFCIHSFLLNVITISPHYIKAAELSMPLWYVQCQRIIKHSPKYFLWEFSVWFPHSGTSFFVYVNGSVKISAWKSHYFSELLIIPLIFLHLWLYFCTVLLKSQKFFHRRVSMSSACHHMADDWTPYFGFGNSGSGIFPNLGNVGLIDPTVHQLEWYEFSYYRGSSPITQHFYKCIILAKGCSYMFAQHFWPLQQIEDNENQ